MCAVVVCLCIKCCVEVGKYIGNAFPVVLFMSISCCHGCYQILLLAAFDAGNALQVLVLCQYALNLRLLLGSLDGSHFFFDLLAYPDTLTLVVG